MTTGTFDATSEVPAFGIHDGAKMLECSPDLAEIFGYDVPDEIVGREPLKFIDPAYQDQAMKEVLSDGGGPYHTIGVRADGLRFRMEVLAHPIRYHGREARLVLVRDLSPRALVVDDNEVVRNMVSLLFRKLGYRVVLADSAASALESFRQKRFAVVFTDIVMPDVGGIELVSQIRALDSAVPIVLMSGYSDVPVTLDPNTRMLKKPFGMEELTQELANLPERAREGALPPIPG